MHMNQPITCYCYKISWTGWTIGYLAPFLEQQSAGERRWISDISVSVSLTTTIEPMEIPPFNIINPSIWCDFIVFLHYHPINFQNSSINDKITSNRCDSNVKWKDFHWFYCCCKFTWKSHHFPFCFYSVGYEHLQLHRRWRKTSCSNMAHLCGGCSRLYEN